MTNARTSPATSPATTSAHTPGPWSITDIHAAEPKVCGWVRPDEFALIATIANETDGTEERQANARLIAAAPELLEACKRAKQILGEILYDLEDDKGEGECWEHLHVAIAKAQ